MPSPRTSAESAPATRAAPVVLLAVHDAALRARLRGELEAAGLATAESAGTEASAEACERLDPDAVVVGPWSDHPETRRLCATLRARAASRSRPLIALTPEHDASAIQRAYDAGAADFAALPVTGNELAQRVRFALRAARGEAAGRACAHEPATPPAIDALLDDLRDAMARARDRARHAAVLCIDLDRFKQVTAGQTETACEELLGDVARRLRAGIRDDDVLARLGCAPGDVRLARLRGDEFCLMIRDVRQPADVARVGQRILDLMAEPFPVAGREAFLGVSIGIACYPDNQLSAEGLLEAAEKAAYCAKQERANNLLYYTPGLDQRASERMELEVALRHALERGEFVLHYQPRVDVKSGRIVGAEALVRWIRPGRGNVSPGEFIPLAEETGLIVPLGEWILREACAQNKRWQEAGMQPIRVSVNLSSVQFRQPGLFDSVARVLRETGLDARWLEFEITESLLMKDLDATIAELERFQALGVHLSIDDFGTGYSSLSYLKRLPIGSIKIDQSFVREVTTSSVDSALVTAIILMCRSLKLSVVAEGVETRSQLALLRILQCDEIQGYLVSRPVPAQEFAELLVGSAPSAFAA